MSTASARRSTLQAGEAGGEEWEEHTDLIQKKMPEPGTGANHQVRSADGAMVPLVGGAWADVKTPVLGEVVVKHEGRVQVENRSYCSRLTAVLGCERASLRERHRRGRERAGHGAAWVQGVIEDHRADAVCFLDVPHAAEDVHVIAEAVRETGEHRPDTWLKGVVRQLTHEGPERVLRHLEALCARCPDPDVRKTLQDLRRRQAHMESPTFRAAGWPSGSGMVERANMLVGEAHLTGAGMHGTRANVHAMLLLRHAVCADRWSATWQERATQRQQKRRLRRATRTRARREQAFCRLLAQTFPFFSLTKDQPPPVPSAAPPVPPKPAGRTEAHKRWGRRPVAARGACIKAAFAKK